MSPNSPTTERSAPRRRGRQKKLIDPKLLTYICGAHLGDGRTYGEIRKELRSRGIETGDDSWFAKLLKNARKDGLIFLDLDETFVHRGDELQRDGQDLRNRFNLDHAVVVHIAEPAKFANDSSLTDTSGDESVMRGDDYLHTVLANHAGKLLSGQLNAGDHCAVAGGRAVNQAVRMIRRAPPPLRDIMVTSLGGRLWSHKWWRSGSNTMRPLDPDDSAFILFMALENQPGTMFDQVGHRVFTDSREEAAAVMEEHCMFQPGGKWYQRKQPNRAIVGVGVVDPSSGHRAVRKYEGSGLVKDLMNRHLARVKNELEEAIATVRESELYFGDVANRYFPTLPLPQEFHERSVEYYDHLYGKLNKQLLNLNERMVVVEWAHIRGIRSVTAIAGGSFKLRALWTILFAGLNSKSLRLINTLVTDSATAYDLNTALNAYHGLDASAKAWYEKLVRTFFQGPPRT